MPAEDLIAGFLIGTAFWLVVLLLWFCIRAERRDAGPDHKFEPRIVWNTGRPEPLIENGHVVCGHVTRGADYSGALDGTDHCNRPEREHTLAAWSRR